jgi:hypothetical protein
LQTTPFAYVEGPIAAARAQGNTLEARNGFYWPETMGLVVFSGVDFQTLRELNSGGGFSVRRHVNDGLKERHNLRRSYWGCAKPYHGVCESRSG